VEIAEVKVNTGKFTCLINKIFAKEKLFVNTNIVDAYKIYGINDKHVFFGYYDLAQINKAGNKMLVHVVDRNAEPERDKAEIGYFDLENGDYVKVTTTSTWCWQQGSRLRWHPQQHEKILFNDVDNNVYVMKEADVNSNEINILTSAVYDNSYDFIYGVSLNFARLQRLRPGYGYSTLPDLSIDHYAPNEDGVFLINLDTKEKKLIISLNELSRVSDISLLCEHYINHVSFSPDGRRFMFFHVAVGAKSSGKKTKVYIYNINSEALKLIENDWKASHYCWCNNNELMITAVTKEKKAVYAIYDIENNVKKIIDYPSLTEDGHPSFFTCGDKIVTDTYPDKRSYQKLFLHDIMQDKMLVLANFYHKPVNSIDLRCDLHPRLWENGNKRIITVDTTCDKGLRQAALLDIKS